MSQYSEPSFWARTALWMFSIYLVAVPMRALKIRFGDGGYVAASLIVLFAFFALGIALSRLIDARRNGKQRPGRKKKN